MIGKEDYIEFCASCKTKTEVPLRRILEKLDEYLYSKNFEGAVRHLAYWREEAAMLGDERGGLSLLNETVGLFRKIGREGEAMEFCQKALTAVQNPDFSDSITKGTTYLNVATAYEAFDKTEEAIAYYQKAQEIYETYLKEDDGRLGGLYNNMALALCGDGQYEKSDFYFQKALNVMGKTEGSEPELAMTYCNMADLRYAQKGFAGKSEIDELLRRAFAALQQCKEHDGYFAYTCEKCGPVFGVYGFEKEENQLKEWAENQ